MRIIPCMEPTNQQEAQLFMKYRVEAIKKDLKNWKEKFKKYEIDYSTGMIKGDLYDKDGMFMSLQDLTRHIRQVEWLLSELRKLSSNEESVVNQ